MELNTDAILMVEDIDIIDVVEDADALLARLVADGELLTGGKRPEAPRRKRSRRGRGRR